MKYYSLSYKRPWSNAAGAQRFFFIRIDPRYRSDQSLHAHELEHVKQWWFMFALGLCVCTGLTYWLGAEMVITYLAAPFLHGALYRLRPYRKWAEVAAHRVQVKAGGSREILAKHLATAYKLKLTYDDAWELIG